MENVGFNNAQRDLRKVASSMFQGLFPGAMGGTCCVFVGHPWDLIKVRMQTASLPLDTPSAKGVVEPRGTLSIIRSIAIQDGFFGFYRGVFPPLASVVPAFAVTFLANDFAQTFIRGYWPSSNAAPMDSSHRLTIGQYCFAGGFTAIPAAAILAPSERVKCLLQVQKKKIADSGARAEARIMIDCIKQLYSTGGMRSLYKGSLATLLRDIPGNAAYFGAYELTRSTVAEFQGLDDVAQLSLIVTMFAGGMAGVFNWIVALPMDVVKSRYQAAPEGVYKSYSDVLARLLENEGIRGLYRGLAPALLRAFPANAACFLGVELTRKLIAPYA